MSDPFSRLVSPAKCNEKPWDFWISEIGHLSPRPDEAFAAPEGKGGASRRPHDAHPYKGSERRYRRAGLHRLRHDAMPLHGLFPQADNLNAAVCHMCGVVVKCSAAYRHLRDAHPADPLPPPPPPRNRSRHKKEQLPPSPAELVPLKREVSPAHPTTPPLARLVLPTPEMYLEEATAPAPGEVQVCVETGELPVVSIQDTEDLPLGDNLTDDIFEIMNSEGIQSADDITNSADWKNIIRDIGNLQDLNFSQPTDQVPEVYAPLAYSLAEAPAEAESAPPPRPPPAPSTPSKASRSKSSKSKFNLREYDPNKHCGVVTLENSKPCTRSLTCKAHALSLRRLVEGRAKSFDTLLAEHRASREAAAVAAGASAPALPAPPAPASAALPPLLVNTTLDLSAFNGLTAEQQVNDIYVSLLRAEDPILPDTTSITSLLSQPLDGFLMPDDAEIPAPRPIASTRRGEEVARRVEETTRRGDESTRRGDETTRRGDDLTRRGDDTTRRGDEAMRRGEEALPGEVCWYASCPRPLAICTYNASHAGGAVALGKRYATVRSNIKSSLSRSQSKTSGTTNNFYYGPNPSALTLSKSVHMNASKSNKPEVRKLIVTCSDSGGGGKVQTLSELFGGEVRHGLNGHVGHGMVGKARAPLKHSRGPPSALELGFLDPLLADEKC